ncbi:unnamed protein product [Phytomonas sp. EM1]|nr:unnamed protein product [Phytomonas sp. EM1]|eukprot:CCW60625.1 unnamed protein product [Phytomonas sp. isolate EM1]
MDPTIGYTNGKRPHADTPGSLSILKIARLSEPLGGENIITAPVQSSSSAPTLSETMDVTNPFTGRPYSPSYFNILEARHKLPVYEKKELIQKTVLANPLTLLVGETGSGKTTQVPHFLAEMQVSFPGLIACTQPRRIAAISVATRVAEEMDVVLGEEVGFHVRFQSKKSEKTRVLYLTDGMLLRETASDRDLSKYNVVVVDEAHERTIDTDVLLGLLKQLLTRRPALRVVVMSATLDVGKIQSFFPQAPLLQVSGRMFEVEVVYAPQLVKDYVEEAVRRVCEIHRGEPAGDVLCFLTGEAEIERAVAATQAALTRTSAGFEPASEGASPSSRTAASRPSEAMVLPLFGSLSLAEQQKVFRGTPPGVRKIVFATNIAETSVTIDGVVYVVDCGYQKQSLYNSQARVDYLVPAVISQASAEQRKGRAGRTRPGKCYRLYTTSDFRQFPPQTYPEILRTNLVNPVLLLLTLGVGNPCEFPFIDPPSQDALEDAFYQLLFFGAVDDALGLTEFGARMAAFPVDAWLSRMLLKAEAHRCAADVAVVAAMLEAGNVFVRPPSRAAEADQARAQFAHPDGDHLTLFFIFHGYFRHQSEGAKYCWSHFLRHQTLQQAVQIYHQLRQLMTQHHISVCSTYEEKTNTVDTVALRRAILEGFFTQVAYLPPKGNHYLTVRDGLTIQLHRQSVLSSKSRMRPTWIMYDRLEVHGEDGMFVRVASPVEPEWLLQTSEFFFCTAEISNGEAALVLKKLAAQEVRTKAV